MLVKIFVKILLTLTVFESVSCNLVWKDNIAQGCDFPDHDMLSVPSSKDQCRANCASTPGCTHFTWANQAGGYCYLKNGWIQKKDAIKNDAPDTQCGILSDKTAGRDVVEWKGNSAIECDFTGNDMKSATVPSNQCRSFCASTPGCTHYSWQKDVCYLKNGPVAKKDARRNYTPFMHCGVMSDNIPAYGVFEWNGNSAIECDFPGNDLKLAEIPSDECRARCGSTPGCTHYSWQKGTCYMKKGLVTKRDAVKNYTPFMHCGLMKDYSDNEVLAASL